MAAAILQANHHFTLHTISHCCLLLARFSSTPSGLMAGGDWESELRNKLRRLAGGDTGWLLLASTTLEQQSEIYKKLFLEEEDDDHAHKLVIAIEVMKRESPCSTAWHVHVRTCTCHACMCPWPDLGVSI